MSDIVTRLRKQVARAEVDGVLPSWDFAKVVWEAADEIERLRADKDHWFHLARRLFDLIPETSSEALHRANVLRDYEESAHKELEKALSGE